MTRGAAVLLTVLSLGALSAQDTRKTATYQRLKSFLDSVPAIDTHEHVRAFGESNVPGPGMTLYTLFNRSYFTRINTLTPWEKGSTFEEWWTNAKHDFDDARATSFYRYQLSAFEDLYGVDFETITDAQAKALNDKIVENYRDEKWLYHVITERSNIELMLVDPFWARLDFSTYYPFGVLVFNVTTLTRGFHPSEYSTPTDDPYIYARKKRLEVSSLDDYLNLLDDMFKAAKAAGAVCLKTTLAYERTLRFDRVPRERAEKVFGRRRSEMSAAEAKAFEDFVMWRLVELSAKHALPFQIHTGQARIQGSNPMLLVDLIESNPDTKFILFHGGFPWVDETGVILMTYPSHVWIDSCWLPTLSYSAAKRAYHEWLEVMPSSRILWGADALHPEGIYGATEYTRRCLAEVLAEKVDRGDLREEHARRIGRQILRENALDLFPQLRKKLWKHRGKLEPGDR